MQVHDLKPPRRSRKRKRIVGRGQGSGAGKTCGRGENGQGARPGSGVRLSSEGGQMALIRRLPKVGFRSHRPVVYQVVKIENLTRFKEGTVVDIDFLKSHGLVKSINKPVKILGDGELKKPLTVKANSFSKAAEEKIKKAGGKAETVKLGRSKKEEQPA